MAMALTLVGAVVSAAGAISQGNAQAAAANYNAKVAERNKVATLEQTYTEVENQRSKNRKMIGEMRSAYGANGLEMAGTPLDVISDTVAEQEYDVQKQKYVGRMKAMGFSEQAALSRMEAKSAKKAGYIGAASSLIGGLSDAVQGSPAGSSMFGSMA
jgi:hypothetical protein